MSSAQKEKLEIYTDASLQLIPKEAEESIFPVVESCTESSLEERKKEAGKPLYLKRV